MQYSNTCRNQLSWKWLIFQHGILLGLLSILIMPVWAFVGYVDEVNGPRTAFSLNGQDGRLSLGKQVNQGDKIEVLKPGNSVMLLLGNKSVSISYTYNNPYKVPNPPPPKSGFFRVARDWVKGLFGYDVKTTTTLTKSIDCQDKMSNPLSFPLLTPEKNAKLLEGTRRLYIAWSGSSSFYQVQVYRVLEDREEKVDYLWDTTPKCSFLTEIALKEWTFKTGEFYRLKIIDSHQQVTQGQFRVVFNSQDPRLQWSPQEAEELRASSILRAIWLAQQGHGEWRLEAYQQIAWLKTHSAWLVKRGLAEELAQEEVPLSTD